MVAWLVSCVVLGTLLTVAMVLVAKRGSRVPSSDLTTGRVVPPTSLSPEEMLPGATWRVITGGIVVGRLGKVHATWPLVLLDVTTTDLTLRMRPAFLGAMFGARPLTATLGPGIQAFPARSSWSWGSYVGIRTPDGGEGYVYASDPGRILNRLAFSGCDVDPRERKIQLF